MGEEEEHPTVALSKMPEKSPFCDKIGTLTSIREL